MKQELDKNGCFKISLIRDTTESPTRYYMPAEYGEVVYFEANGRQDFVFKAPMFVEKKLREIGISFSQVMMQNPKSSKNTNVMVKV